MADSITRHPNDANYIVRHLSTKPNDALKDFDEWIAFLSTPFKRLGIQGWTQTGCSASGYGKPVRDAQWSTDQFFTIDVEVLSLAVASRKETVTMPKTTEPRYVRLEVEPGTRAHSVCVRDRPTANDTIGFKGVVLIDQDGPFYEVHPSRLWFYTRSGPRRVAVTNVLLFARRLFAETEATIITEEVKKFPARK